VNARRDLLAAVLLIASCSSDGADTAAVGTSSAVADTAAATTDSTLPTATPSRDQTVVLTCAESGHPTTPADAQDVNANGLTFSGVEPAHKRLSSPEPVSDGAKEMFFEKVFLYVSVSASPTTRLTLISPTDAFFYYVAADTWQSPIADADRIRDATRSVMVSRCDTDLAGYFGGILLSSGACVVINVEGESATDEVNVALPLPGPC
jgi:hypothetical protein